MEIFQDAAVGNEQAVWFGVFDNPVTTITTDKFDPRIQPAVVSIGLDLIVVDVDADC